MSKKAEKSEKKKKSRDLLTETLEELYGFREYIGGEKAQEKVSGIGNLVLKVCDEILEWPEKKPIFSETHKSASIEYLKVSAEDLCKNMDASIKITSDIADEIYKLESKKRSILGGIHD